MKRIVLRTALVIGLCRGSSAASTASTASTMPSTTVSLLQPKGHCQKLMNSALQKQLPAIITCFPDTLIALILEFTLSRPSKRTWNSVERTTYTLPALSALAACYSELCEAPMVAAVCVPKHVVALQYLASHMPTSPVLLGKARDDEEIRVLAFSPDCQKLFSLSRYGLRVWMAKSKSLQQLQNIPHQAVAKALWHSKPLTVGQYDLRGYSALYSSPAGTACLIQYRRPCSGSSCKDEKDTKHAVGEIAQWRLIKLKYEKVKKKNSKTLVPRITIDSAQDFLKKGYAQWIDEEQIAIVENRGKEVCYVVTIRNIVHNTTVFTSKADAQWGSEKAGMLTVAPASQDIVVLTLRGTPIVHSYRAIDPKLQEARARKIESLPPNWRLVLKHERGRIFYYLCPYDGSKPCDIYQRPGSDIVWYRQLLQAQTLTTAKKEARAVIETRSNPLVAAPGQGISAFVCTTECLFASSLNASWPLAAIERKSSFICLIGNAGFKELIRLQSDEAYKSVLFLARNAFLLYDERAAGAGY